MCVRNLLYMCLKSNKCICLVPLCLWCAPASEMHVSLGLSQRMSAESEDIGREVLANLHGQGQTIRNSRNKLNESDEHLGD